MMDERLYTPYACNICIKTADPLLNADSEEEKCNESLDFHLIKRKDCKMLTYTKNDHP